VSGIVAVVAVLQPVLNAINSLVQWIQWELLKQALSGPISQWYGTPYAETGRNTEIQAGADCSGLVYSVYRDAGYYYDFAGPNTTYPEWNFALSVKKGGRNEKRFKEVSASELHLWGDIVYWHGLHMAIFMGKKDGSDMIFNATIKRGAITMRLDVMNDSLKGVMNDGLIAEPTNWYRWRFLQIK
jgi:hypothetical protein